MHEVLAKSNIEAEQVQKLVLCGGTAKIPKLQKSIASIFGKGELRVLKRVRHNWDLIIFHTRVVSFYS